MKTLTIDQVEIHPLAETFPSLDTDDFSLLAVDILTRGIQVPLVFIKDTDILVDGVHRLKAWSKMGLEDPYPVHEIEESEVYDHVISVNLRRRHMNESQRAIVAAKLSELSPVGRPATDSDAITIDEAADRLKVSSRLVQQARKVNRDAIPEVQQAVADGQLTVSDAETAIKQLTDEEQAKAIEEYRRPTDDLPSIGKDTLMAAHRRVIRAEQAVMETPPLPDDIFRVVVIDPPWPVAQNAPMEGALGGIPYVTMDLGEIVEFDVPGVLADDAWVFLWTTHKFLPAAIQITELWDLTYITTMVWDKQNGPQLQGTMRYTGEFIVVAKKGAPKFADTKNFRAVNQWPRREHSEKPQEFYELIDRVCDVRKGDALDIFNRRVINDKWTGYGFEAKE